MDDSSALPSESMAASGNHETTLGVSRDNSMANSSNLPSESQVAPGNHETALGVDCITNSSSLPSESIATPVPGAGKKISKMRPGTTNTARYDIICDCG